jgi:hypothetical protein
MTIYDDDGNVVRRGTMYSHRGTIYSQNGVGSGGDLRKRPSSQAPRSNDSHVAFPTIATSIQEAEEPTISQLLRREEVSTSPEPASPRPSFLGVRPGHIRLPGQTHKLSSPTQPTQVTATPAAVPEAQRRYTMPEQDLKKSGPSSDKDTKEDSKTDEDEKEEDLKTDEATVKVENGDANTGS